MQAWKNILLEVTTDLDAAKQNLMFNTQDELDAYTQAMGNKLASGTKVYVKQDKDNTIEYTRKNDKWERTDILDAQLSKLASKKPMLKSMDLDILFMKANGFCPILLDGVPLYCEDKNTLVKIASIDKNNKFFEQIDKSLKNKLPDEFKTYDDDIIYLTPYKIEDFGINPENKYQVHTFVKSQDDKISMTVREFKNSIYENPRNAETIDRIEQKETGEGAGSLEDIVNKAIENSLKNQQDKKAKDLETAKSIKYYNSNLTQIINDQRFGDSILKVLVTKKQAGWLDNDLEVLANSMLDFKKWEVSQENQVPMSTLDTFYKNLTDESKKQFKTDIKQKKIEWYKAGLKADDLLKEVKSLILSGNYKTAETKEESILQEDKYGYTQDKPIAQKYPGDVANTLLDLGIDSKWLRVPFTIPGIKDGDETIKRDEQYTIAGFPDIEKIERILKLQSFKQTSDTLTEILQNPEENSNSDVQDLVKKYNEEKKQLAQVLSKYHNDISMAIKKEEESALVDIKEYYKGYRIGSRPQSINLSDLYTYLDSPINQDVDVTEIGIEQQLVNPNENWNQAMFKKVRIPDTVIQQMVDVVHKEYEDEIPKGYTIPYNLTGKTFKNYIGTPALKIALNLYNSAEFQNYAITQRYSNTEQKTIYYGVVPNDPKSKMNSFPHNSVEKKLK